jgi:hypothetical protein
MSKPETGTVDLYAESLQVLAGPAPTAELCVECVTCETCELCEPPGPPCEFCDTGTCECFSVFCDSCIA